MTTLRNEDNLKNKDNLKIEEDLKNQDNLKIEDDLKRCWEWWIEFPNNVSSLCYL